MMNGQQIGRKRLDRTSRDREDSENKKVRVTHQKWRKQEEQYRDEVMPYGRI